MATQQIVSDIKTVSKVAEGLSHPVRAKIYDILKTQHELKVKDLVRLLADSTPELARDRTAVDKHLVKMERAGILHVEQDYRGFHIVKLDLEIEILLKPVSESYKESTEITERVE